MPLPFTPLSFPHPLILPPPRGRRPDPRPLPEPRLPGAGAEEDAVPEGLVSEPGVGAVSTLP